MFDVIQALRMNASKKGDSTEVVIRVEKHYVEVSYKGYVGSGDDLDEASMDLLTNILTSIKPNQP